MSPEIKTCRGYYNLLQLEVNFTDGIGDEWSFQYPGVDYLGYCGCRDSKATNYDENSNDLFLWYQQLVAESLGKKSKGILPVISSMPKDNHSLMQLYLDGKKNNFFTFFFVDEISNKKIKKNKLLKTLSYLKNKDLNDIKKAQFDATQKVFNNKRIPFRSFIIKKRNEETLGELFTFFILETILLGKALNLNPYNQPAVELIKTETKKFLLNS